MSIELKHKAMVAALVKPAGVIRQELTDDQVGLIHATLGVAGEAGEIVDAVKKWVIYQKPLDYDNLVEELGDIEFYLEDIRRRTGITRGATLIANMEKLAKRYPDYHYTDARAHDRADKV